LFGKLGIVAQADRVEGGKSPGKAGGNGGCGGVQPSVLAAVERGGLTL